MQQIDYADRAAQAEGLADAVADKLRAALAQRGRAVLALSGGTTPALFFEALARRPLDWGAVTVLPADERWVPVDHPRSNAALIRRHLIRDEAALAVITNLYEAGVADPQDAEAAITARIAPLLPLDVLVLGMGDDWHTASLFPQAPRIAEAMAPGAPPLMAMTAPDGEARMTLTLPALNTARSRYLLLTGADKAARLNEARALPADTDPAKAPIRAMLDGTALHWAP